MRARAAGGRVRTPAAAAAGPAPPAHALAAALGVALGLLVAWPAAAGAHPLGNFSVNHLTRVKVSSERVELRYLLDQAEVPTFQERSLAPAEVLERKRAEVAEGLRLFVNGSAVPLRLKPGGRISFPPGQGGLRLTRVELELAAAISEPRRVVLRDESFADRVGWKAIVPEPGDGTAVVTDTPSGDPTNGLRSYPAGLLDSPREMRSATLDVRPGAGTLRAPEGPGGESATTAGGGGDGFAGVFDDAASGESVLVLLLLVAFGWGAVHALSPGHGKAMVAAYLIGTRGTARHALALGGIVTFTHTIGVFLLGAVTLALSQYILPEDLYPWLNLAAGLLVVSVGLGVLRSRLRWAQARRDPGAVRDHRHGHDHAHGHERAHGHDRAHHHEIPDRVTWKGLAGMGAAAGLIPCPSALVVLLGAIAQHQVGLGLVLILAFSAGLAATLTAIGLAFVYARRLVSRVRVPGRFAALLPALSALVIVGVGFVLTAQAVPQLA